MLHINSVPFKYLNVTILTIHACLIFDNLKRISLKTRLISVSPLSPSKLNYFKPIKSKDWDLSQVRRWDQYLQNLQFKIFSSFGNLQTIRVKKEREYRRYKFFFLATDIRERCVFSSIWRSTWGNIPS